MLKRIPNEVSIIQLKHIDAAQRIDKITCMAAFECHAHVYLYLYEGRRVHPVWQNGHPVDLVFETLEEIHPLWNEYQFTKTCYQCEKKVAWLAPDSRCASCTRWTPEEIRGEEEYADE